MPATGSLILGLRPGMRRELLEWGSLAYRSVSGELASAGFAPCMSCVLVGLHEVCRFDAPMFSSGGDMPSSAHGRRLKGL